MKKLFKLVQRLRKIFALAEYGEKLSDYPQTVFVTEEILLDLADSQTPQGIVAIVQKEEEQLPDFTSGKYLFLEDVQDPGNVGTIDPDSRCGRFFWSHRFKQVSRYL